MDKGRILKVRIGHEADCSSGMVALFILIVAAVTHLPLSLIAAIVQAAKLEKDAPRNKWRILYWLVPQVLGLVLTAFLVRMATTGSLYGAESELLELAYAIGVSFALAITAGYILAPRIRYLVCLIVPLIFVGGIGLSFWFQVIPPFMLIVSAATYLPLSVITAAVQASKLTVDAPRNRKRLWYWLVPQVLGLVLTAFLVRMATTGSSYGAESGLLELAYAIGVSFALAITAGYILAPRIRYLVCLIVPLIFVGGIGLFSWLLVIIFS